MDIVDTGEKSDNKINLIDALIEKSHGLNGKILVTGGHFVVSDKTLINLGTLISFQVAVKVYQRITNTKGTASIGILINDIGAVCNPTSCSLSSYIVDRDKFKLPEEYLQILTESQIDPSQLEIFWEKHMRNISQKELLKRLVKDDSIRVIDGESWLTIEDMEGNPENLLLARKSPHCATGTPACPLIMAGYAIEQIRRGYDSAAHYYYVGEDNFDNIPNHFNIEKGAKTARHFDVSLCQRNIYFSFESIFLSNY